MQELAQCPSIHTIYRTPVLGLIQVGLGENSIEGTSKKECAPTVSFVLTVNRDNFSNHSEC